jgi:nucleoside 2-deoxyribosyltransferase
MYREALPDYNLDKTACCPVCGSQAHQEILQPSNSYLFICPICGKFRTDHYTTVILNGWREQYSDLMYRAMHQLREAAERAIRIERAYTSLYPVHRQEDFKNMLESRDLPVQQKMNMLLQYLGRISTFPGSETAFDIDTDYSVLQARNADEALFYLRSLKSQRLLTANISMGTSLVGVTLNTSGWNELERMTQAGGDSTNGFVAMWFDPSRAEFDRAIDAAIRTAGYLPLRIDRLEHVNRIDDEIIARIRQSKFLVADFTGQRNGVYFEAGFMLGLGRTVIWLCDKSELNKVHFDTRQYNTIDYTSAADLEQRLRIRIEAIMGRGPHK